MFTQKHTKNLFSVKIAQQNEVSRLRLLRLELFYGVKFLNASL